VKAQTLPEVIRAFDPMHPLVGQELKDWYIDRPGNPLERMKIYLQGLGLANKPVKILFTGHMGSGKSTTLNKLAEELKRQFFIVPFDVRQSASMADLTYIDLVLGIATSLFKRATEADVLGKAPAQIASDVWEDISRFIEKVIFGPATFRTPPADAELSAKVNFLAAEFQTKFASEATTRDEVRKRVESRLAELHDKINQVADLVLVNYKRPVLFFVENTDKPDLARARDIFWGHTYALTAFRASVIYTLPIGLRYSAADFNLIKDHFTETFVLTNLKVADLDGSPNQMGLECLAEVLSARMVEGLIEEEAQDQIIRASGGLMRTLIQLTRRSAVNAMAAGDEVISVDNAKAAINEERANFVAGLSRDDYPVLYDRHHDKQLSGDDAVLRLLQTRALLEYANGDPWCDVHPIALPLVLDRASQKEP
jgi:DNA-binding protein Fis